MTLPQTSLLKTLGVGTVLGLGAVMGVTIGLVMAIVAAVSRRAAASVGTGLVGCAALIAVCLLSMRRRSRPRLRARSIRGAGLPGARPSLV